MTYDYPVSFSCWEDEEHRAIARVHESGRYTMHDECAAFEAEFAAYHGMHHGIMVNSGSSANLIAVASLFHKEHNPLRPGDRAIVPAIAWATTYAPLVQYGLDLIVADVDATWNAKIGKSDARLAVPVSVLGNPGYLNNWAGVEYCIEDNCESLGAEVGTTGYTKKTGTFGDLNTFSFFHSHQLSAIEGGMILTNDDELAGLCRLLRNHGNAGFVRGDGDFDNSYDFRLFGYNVRPLELHAAIARAQLPKLEGFRQHRQQNLNAFAVMTEGMPIYHQQRNLPGIPSPFGIAFSVENSDVRSRLVTAFRKNGIDCRLPTGGSFLRHSYARRWNNQSTPNADWLHGASLFLGNAPYPITEKIYKAVEIMRGVL